MKLCLYYVNSGWHNLVTNDFVVGYTLVLATAGLKFLCSETDFLH
jgi:hypothetical protein